MNLDQTRAPPYLFGLQLGGAALAMLVLPLWPPASGPMLLVPLGPIAERAMIRTAVRRGALLMGSGPLPRSFVVYGERDRLAGPLARVGVLAIGARGAGCAAERTGSRSR